MRSRRWLVAGSLLVYPAAGRAAPPTDPPYNVIMIGLDTVRADHLGCYGYSRDTSPNIDALATESVVFDNAISQASWTLPSFASLLTSRYVGSHGIRDERKRLNPSVSTLAQALQGAGYDTGAFAAEPFFDRRYGLDKGFGTYEVSKNGFFRYSMPLALEWIERHRHRP